MLVPPLVLAAKESAKRLGFSLRPEGNPAGRQTAGPSACLDTVGSLLRALAASRPDGDIGEVGTGAGVGTAWLKSGMQGRARLVTIEVEGRLVQVAKELFAAHPEVRVVHGDWLDLMPEQGPFDLLFFDGGGRGALVPANWRAIAGLLKPGGVLVFDDLTPEALWPDSWHGKPDPKREFAFKSGYFAATELLTGQSTAALLLTRLTTDG